jgi:hypothetical protein
MSTTESLASIKISKKETGLTKSEKFPDCSELVLLKGKIHVLYETPDGLKRQTCEVKKNDTEVNKKDEGKQCHVHAGKLPSWLDLVAYQKSSAGKKMDETVSRLPGIPYGRVYNLERAAMLNLAKAGLSQWNLTLLDASSKKPLYRQSGNSPTLQMPSNLLRLGGKYTLVIDGGPQKYTGGFDLLGGAAAADIAAQIKQAHANTDSTPRAKKLDELIIYYENNLDYEVELLREELHL